MLLRDRLRVADVGLAHFDEAAAAGQQPQRGVDERPGERVEHDVDAAPLGGVQELGFELVRPRGGDVVAVEAERRERVPLARLRSGEDLRAQVRGDLQRRHADPAGRRRAAAATRRPAGRRGRPARSRP